MPPKNSKWSEPETTLLISLYGEYFDALEKMAKKKPIHEKISAKLRENGHERNANQVCKKIANLREEYKKKKPGLTGDEKPSWMYYEALHKILHERPALNEACAVTSEIGFGDEDDGQILSEIGVEVNVPFDDEVENEEPRNNLIVEPPNKKLRVSDRNSSICQETLNFLKERAKDRDEEKAELKKTNENLVAALNRIASSSESIAESIKKGPWQ